MSNAPVQNILEAGRWIDAQGWCPATGGNFSERVGSNEARITASGRHKGRLEAADLLRVDLDGRVLGSDLTPSAETLLHCCLYRLDAQIGAVLHTHSVNSTVLSRLTAGDSLQIEGFEMQKALRGNHTHDEAIDIALFDNTQDMQALAAEVQARWSQAPLSWGLLVRGHGLYAWGRDMSEARRHLEALEFLFACIMDMKRLGARI
ncbi:methylthioribulose-1-phosphate dehydratase [Marinobacterium nitratireducens]|uniref:Methylthioribulose-1-phosphate dehydratase n=1 Tax=Marinobacterium nitratireducens TaxID=518897 RepID=A0A918DQ69_9GAMM|nr:methylthioribulose 1-phosphate dehydratase [Marinobacterium nitratireducens]GGO79679.1 methylthioribulose-1-phosphate dehydratase [Marinobacterium nitratireducens]